jgi:hypothetical protein
VLRVIVQVLNENVFLNGLEMNSPSIQIKCGEAASHLALGNNHDAGHIDRQFDVQIHRSG